MNVNSIPQSEAKHMYTCCLSHTINYTTTHLHTR